MGNLIKLIQKYFTFILFILLEVFCFSIIVKNNAYHKVAFINKSNSVSNSFYAFRYQITSFISLRQVNDSIAKMNASLLSQWANQRKPEPPDTGVAVLNSPYFDFIPAIITRNSISQTRNFIYINKGRLDGIENDMGVISEHGPVGKVVNITNHYACVRSFLHRDNSIAVKVKNTHYFGSIVWEGKDIRVARLEDIPKHIKVKKGDTVMTSGYSSFFPEDLPVGRIIKFENNPTNNFADAQVLLFNDFGNMHHVYVIKNLRKKEIDSLDIKTTDLTKTDE